MKTHARKASVGHPQNTLGAMSEISNLKFQMEGGLTAEALRTQRGERQERSQQNAYLNRRQKTEGLTLIES